MNFQPIDPDYVRRLAERDPDTERHFTQYFGGLLRLKIRARVRSWTLGEDILQETLARVLELVKRKGVASPDRFGAFGVWTTNSRAAVWSRVRNGLRAAGHTMRRSAF